MHSDLERAGQNWQQVSQALRQFESQCSEMPSVTPRHEAELHLARLRAFIAHGRVMALERSCHAHMACEEAPASYIWSLVNGRGSTKKAS